MGDVDAYYRDELKKLGLDHGLCVNCGEMFETQDQTNLRYPFKSYVCKCTLCRECINSCGEKITPGKTFTFDCPRCETKKAWNLRKLLPDLQFANLLDAVNSIVPYGMKKEAEPRDGGAVDRDDGCEDDHSNGGEVNDGSGKRKWRGKIG
jgi:Fe-S oxidoreductase